MDIKFIKWPSIDNITNISNEDFCYLQDNIHDWVVTEKIDGTNISINVTEHNFLLGKRSSLLGENSSFYNVYKQVHKIESVIKALQNYIYKHKDVYQLTMYGEYFGPQVINRIYYGNDYQFRFYGMCYILKSDLYNVVWLDFNTFQNIMKEYHIENFIVPILGVYKNFEDACNHINNGVTNFSDEKHHNSMEGIVLEPFYDTPISGTKNFIFKSKNKDFLEKCCSTVKKHCELAEESEIKSARLKFKDYCVESRMYSVFSKEGLPTSNKNIGAYINKFINDAKTDFLKENPEYKNFTDKEMKYITNIGNLGFILYTNVYKKLNNC